MTLTKLNAVVFLTLVCATGATATNYYWNPSAATGRLTLLEIWGTMSGGTWTAVTALPTTSENRGDRPPKSWGQAPEIVGTGPGKSWGQTPEK